MNKPRAYYPRSPAWLNLLDPDGGIYLWIMLGRVVAVFGALYRFSLHGNDSTALIGIELPLITCGYLLLQATLFGTVLRTRYKNSRVESISRHGFITSMQAWRHIVTDLLFFAAIYALTGRPESDFYLFIFLPLAMAVYFLPPLPGVISFICTATLATAIAAIHYKWPFPVNSSQRPSANLISNVFLLRAAALIAASYALTWLRNRTRLLRNRQAALEKAIDLVDKADSQSTLFKAIVEAVPLLGFESGSLWLFDHEQGNLKRIDSTSIQDTTSTTGLADPSWVAIVRDGRPRRFRLKNSWRHQLQTEYDWVTVPNQTNCVSTEKAQEWIAVPISDNGAITDQRLRVIGKLILDNRITKRPILGTDLEMLSLFSRCITNALVTLQNIEVYRSLVESVPWNIYRIDASGRITFANTKFCHTYSAPLQELIGKTARELYGDVLGEIYERDDKWVFTNKKLLRKEEPNQPPGQPVQMVTVVKSPLFDAAENLIGLQAVFWNIAELVGVDTVLLKIEANNNVAEAHGETQGVLGVSLETVYGRHFTDLFSEDSRPAVSLFVEGIRQNRHTDGGARARFFINSGSGEIQVLAGGVRASGAKTDGNVLLYIRRLTLLEQDQEKRLLLERFHHVSLVARAIAHDVRNPLQSVMNNIFSLKNSAPSSKDAQDLYLETKSIIGRINKVVEEFGALADQGAKNLQRVDLQETFRRCLKDIEIESSSRGIKINRGQRVWMPHILANQAQVERLFTNIIKNAMEALPDNSGEIDIQFERTTQAGNDEEPSGRLGAISVMVTDNGPGLLIGDLKKATVAGFSTKDPLRGLGLWSCRRILELHGGTLSVENCSQGTGCIVTMTFKL